MNNLTELKKAINDSIEKVNKIPIIKTSNFDTDQLKDEVIPLLKEAKARLRDITYINSNINGIRNEIIKPVVHVIEEKSKQTNWFSWLGILFGVLGVLLTASSLFSNKGNLNSNSISKIHKINADLLEKKEVYDDSLMNNKIIFKKLMNEELKKDILIIRTTRIRDSITVKLNASHLKKYLEDLGYEKVTVSYQDINKAGNREYWNREPYVYHRGMGLNNYILKGVEKFFTGNTRIIKTVYYKNSRGDHVKKSFESNKDLAFILVL